MLLIKYEIMQKVNDCFYSFRDPLYTQNITQKSRWLVSEIFRLCITVHPMKV